MSTPPTKDAASAAKQKLDGTTHFRAKEWELAVASYLQAFEEQPVDTQPEKDEAAVLCSNLAACYCELGNYDLDNKAIPLAEDDAARKRYEAARKKLVELRDSSMAGLSDRWDEIRVGELAPWHRNAMKIYDKNGGRHPMGSFPAQLIWATDQIRAGLEDIDSSMRRLPDGSIVTKTPSALPQIAYAILMCERGWIMISGQDPSFGALQKLHQQLEYEFGTLQLPIPQSTPADVCRFALNTFIHNLVVAAFMASIYSNPGSGTIQWRSLVKIIDACRKQWPRTSSGDTSDAIGDCRALSPTFHRLTKNALATWIEQASHTVSASKKKRLYPDQELRDLANDVVNDCLANPMPDEPITKYGQWTYPIVCCYRSLGLLAFSPTQSFANCRQEGNNLMYYQTKPCEEASEYYFKAAELAATDHLEKSQSYYLALIIKLRIGGMTIRELFDRAAQAENASYPAIEIWGPQDYSQWPDRYNVRKVCHEARLFVADPSSYTAPSLSPSGVNRNPNAPLPEGRDPLDVVLRPVPIVAIDVKREEWFKGVKKAFFEEQVGELTLCQIGT
ncbi:tetratricopeptide repeat containing protein [Pseudohyphozyma bogoriensis]|nr:tetratricopeptide repeat containing protein [Pseudohyphozyma bogoriensis]